jgi:hypothetical protein
VRFGARFVAVRGTVEPANNLRNRVKVIWRLRRCGERSANPDSAKQTARIQQRGENDQRQSVPGVSDVRLRSVAGELR